MPRLDDSAFRIFVSHKHYDQDIASAIKSGLEGLIPRRRGQPPIECFVSGMDIPAATDWRRKIKSELAKSHLLLLLFTRPSHSWDWCLYETGLFARFDREDIQSVVCLYDPGEGTASPISNLQGVPVTVPKVKQFLDRLCHSTHEMADDWRRGALAATKVTDRRLTAVAERIVAAFSRGMDDEDDMYYPCHRLVLDLTGSGAAAGKGIPLDARVIEGPGYTSAYTLSLLGFGAGLTRASRTWRDIVEYLGAMRARWRLELNDAYRNALNEQLFSPIRATLTAWDPQAGAERFYKPVLYRLVRHGEQRRPVQATIVFDRHWEDDD